jgi:hypothetical protein
MPPFLPAEQMLLLPAGEMLPQGILDRLMDVDDKVRCAAASVFCEVAADHPSLAQAGLEPLVGRLRDKKVSVRKEVASQVRPGPAASRGWRGIKAWVWGKGEGRVLWVWLQFGA